jgi:hypothetical protein
MTLGDCGVFFFFSFFPVSTVTDCHFTMCRYPQGDDLGFPDGALLATATDPTLWRVHVRRGVLCVSVRATDLVFADRLGCGTAW